MPVKTSFSIRHYIMLAAYLSLFTRAIYMWLTTTFFWSPFIAVVISAACALLSVQVCGRGLVANPTGLEADLSSYSVWNVLLWLYVITLMGGYTSIVALHVATAVGLANPWPSTVCVSLVAGFIGSYLFKRSFVPHNWQPQIRQKPTT